MIFDILNVLSLQSVSHEFIVFKQAPQHILQELLIHDDTDVAS
jgi:hypothetical protein